MRDTLDFLLHDWLCGDALTACPILFQNSRKTFSAKLDTCKRIA